MLFTGGRDQPGVVVLRPDERPHVGRPRSDGAGPDLDWPGAARVPGELGVSALQASSALSDLGHNDNL